MFRKNLPRHRTGVAGISLHDKYLARGNPLILIILYTSNHLSASDTLCRRQYSSHNILMVRFSREIS